MTTPDPLIERHREWLAYVRPTGLVVSPVVLAERQIALELRAAVIEPWRERLEDLPDEEGAARDPPAVLREVLEWPDGALLSPRPELDRQSARSRRTPVCGPGHPDGQGRGRGLARPRESGGGRGPIDRPLRDAPDGWHASPHARFERLLRETGIPVGLLLAPRRLRLVYAPKSETSGRLDFVLPT